ncbi:serine/threonine-protein kinase D3 isoform X3 [Lepeophtheirus salmonis]|uniref:serine/threonine-protein kinase D3 isoform X3 n=1 Tax=Lepeophtheirus salmonis TaxID=72036 RepID=UPI003AF3AEDF
MTEGHVISFEFQCGIVRDRVLMDSAELTLKSLKEKACQFLEDKVPEHGIKRLSERLLLYRHDHGSSNVLQIINAVTDILEDTIVEIVVNAQHLSHEDIEIRPHSLSIHSYKTPTFCHFCGEMLFGMFKQGLKCEGCGLNFHKRCVFKIPNDCSYRKKRVSSIVGSSNSTNSLVSSASLCSSNLDNSYLLSPFRDGSLSPATSKKERSVSIISAGRPAWVDVQMATRLKIPHTFFIHTYTKPTKCHFCNKMLVGVFKQGLQCKDCGYNAHKKCTDRLPRDCSGEVPENVQTEKDKSEDIFDYENTNGDDSEDDSHSLISGNTSANASEISCLDDMTIRPTISTQPNIPVQRLVQSVKQTKRVGSKILKEGWLVHFTSKGSMKKRHYWRLDTKSITLFQSDSGANYYKEIPLSEILSVEASKKRESMKQCFELKTANLFYYVGEDSQEREEYGIGIKIAKEWEVAIRQALMPVTHSAASIESAVSVNCQITSTSASLKLKSFEERNEETLSQLYQIFSDEILGSGQFGIVYGGVHRQNGEAVAVKVIDKMRFPSKQEAALKNEVSILQNIHHPGVVNLERMFETLERIYVVMEKLKGDMLEMILSSEHGRLSERVTKFVVTQILVALKHLHSKNIVHCDLKPENVLLSSNSDFPQVKLCDFGFARIIGEKGFRKSVVGTPAYLAPEVLRNKGYNRSLDMWSTGVIIYVSLSGTFPFNEDEDINEQIQNASFMYPTHPWKTIDSKAIDLIGNLLQVKSRKRISVDKALLHPWLSDYQCWLDMKELENKLGQRWLTHESDEERVNIHTNEFRPMIFIFERRIQNGSQLFLTRLVFAISGIILIWDKHRIDSFFTI